MKKLIAFILTLLFIFSFSGCVDTGNDGNETTLNPSTTTAPETEPSIDTLKEIDSIVFDSKGHALADALEDFYQDAYYTYYFPNIISEYVTVTYTDGSTEKVKDALANRHILITDLDRYDIRYGKISNNIEKIVDTTVCADDAIEHFYRDENYIYCFTCIKSQYVTVYYKDGTQQNVKDALSEGKILISALDLFGISYFKLPNSYTVPEDFSFALTWGVFGISSYDSKTGKLVKTTDATNPEDYITNYELEAQEKAYIYELIRALDVNSYPDIYDPGNGPSEPSATLILTVRIGGTEKTIKAEDISLFFVSDNDKGQAFLDTCEAISDLLTATDEWKLLPDYENLYE